MKNEKTEYILDSDFFILQQKKPGFSRAPSTAVANVVVIRSSSSAARCG